jgi:hypothetical protein
MPEVTADRAWASAITSRQHGDRATRQRAVIDAPGKTGVTVQAQTAPSVKQRDVVEYVELVTKIVSELAAACAAVFAAYQFRHNVRTRHAEWLFSLFERFYEQETYQNIRAILDSTEGSPELQRLELDVRSGNSNLTVERFINYLNFFETVLVILETHKQLTQKEISDLFDYYLRNLKAVPFVFEFINTQGFERLSRFLKKLP